jgi:hypothetical protein
MDKKMIRLMFGRSIKKINIVKNIYGYIMMDVINEERDFMLIFLLITGILNDNNVSKEDFLDMLEKGIIFDYSMIELEKHLQNTYSSTFVILLITSIYNKIKDNKNIFDKMSERWDNILKDYDR